MCIPSNFCPPPPPTTIDGYNMKVGIPANENYAYLKVTVSHIKICNRKMNTVKRTLTKFATRTAEENFREGIRERFLKMN